MVFFYTFDKIASKRSNAQRPPAFAGLEAWTEGIPLRYGWTL